MKKALSILLITLMAVTALYGCTTTPATPTVTAAPTAAPTAVVTPAPTEKPNPLPDWKPYDELITKIRTATDFNEREKFMHQAEDMLMATGAICPIYFYNDVYMMKPGVEGFYANAFGTKFFMYATYGDNKSLKLCLASEPDRLDPALNSSVDGACLAANSFAGLYTYDAAGNLVPALAEGYTVSDDGLTYIFTLKDGLKWSDGSPLSAKDFEYSWKRAANPETGADYAYQ